MSNQRRDWRDKRIADLMAENAALRKAPAQALNRIAVGVAGVGRLLTSVPRHLEPIVHTAFVEGAR